MDLLKSLRSRFPTDTIVRLGNTYNVARIVERRIIAKSVPYLEDDEELTKDRAKQGYETEKYVLQTLPSWYGLTYVGSFETDTDFINMTYEVPVCKWSTTRIPRPDDIAYQLTKQMNWLHDHNILHNDIAVKNILLTCDGRKAVIIDFEKSRIHAPVTPEERAREIKRMKEDLPASVARYFPMTQRPRSMSAGKRRRTRRRKSTFYS